MNQNIFRIVLLIAITVILTCAKQLPPPGGPIDTALPEVVRISPAPGATNVATDAKIEVVFSERMNRKTVEDAIFISPWPAEEIFYRWRGKKLRIEFSDTLKLNRTYVLTIGAKSSDLRNNKMKDSFSMAFSTSEHIDEGQIWGTVYSQSGIEGTLVCAYLLRDSVEVDPVIILADYYTQCNQQGVYQLMYVAPGNYRLFAIKDKDENRRYTRGVDGLGITTTDIMLTENQKRIQNINFQMTQEDTIPPMLKSAYAINQSNIILRFSEELAAFDESSPRKYFSIYPEKDPAAQLSITTCFKSSIEPATILLMTEKQSPMTYKMIVRNLTDKSQNTLDTLYDSALFEGSTEIDTLKPRIIYRSIPDSSAGIPFAPEIRFGFSEAMERNSFEKVFILKEEGEQVIRGKFNWQNPADVSFLPDSLLKSLCHYSIQILPDSIFDLSGNSLDDSLATMNFKTVNQDTLSAISGEIIDQQEDAGGRLFLNAKSEKNTYQLIPEQPGRYRFENILPGIYTISGFRDADSNAVYSFGKINPFVPAERFFFNPDSIKVRSRWPNEGNKIIIQ